MLAEATQAQSICAEEAKKSPPPTHLFKSIFDRKAPYIAKPPQFFPADSFQKMGLSETLQAPMDTQNLSAWDFAVRYHELKSRRSGSLPIRRVRKLSVEAVLSRAQNILGVMAHPFDQKTGFQEELPPDAFDVELDLEETIEAQSARPVLSYRTQRVQPLVLSIDTSLSMTGEKMAFTAVALAVVLLQFQDDPIGIVAFENQAKILKAPQEKGSISRILERFLDGSAQGYTHLEDGMKLSIRVAHQIASLGFRKSVPVILLSDGKYTAGRDPSYLAEHCAHWRVIKIGKERAGLKLCQEISSKGRAAPEEVENLEDLPKVMYRIVKSILNRKIK